MITPNMKVLKNEYKVYDIVCTHWEIELAPIWKDVVQKIYIECIGSVLHVSGSNIMHPPTK